MLTIIILPVLKNTEHYSKDLGSTIDILHTTIIHILLLYAYHQPRLLVFDKWNYYNKDSRKGCLTKTPIDCINNIIKYVIL